jgi:hypothetical protein
MLQCSKVEEVMRKPTKSGRTPSVPPTFVDLLSGWVQQGVESFFATQRILVDIAMRQNTAATKNLQEGIFHPEHSPVAILAELATTGTSSFVEAQKILLNLAQQENEILMSRGKEQIGGSVRAVALTDLVRRSLDTFIRMQQDFLATTSKQTLQWLDGVKAGKGYQNAHLIDLAREGMETFVETQKKFLDVIAQETARATTGKHEAHLRPMKKTELSKLATEATNSFIDAQKRLLDVMGQLTNVNLKTATKTIRLLSPSRILPIANLTGDGVKDFVSAEKALIESIITPRKDVARRPQHTATQAKTHKARVAHAGA